MDITAVPLGEVIEGFKCPKCREKEVRKMGLKKEKSYLECRSCFLSEWTETNDAKFTYEPPKEPKKKKEEN
jgi:transcription elongation factor Elf1